MQFPISLSSIRLLFVCLLKVWLLNAALIVSSNVRAEFMGLIPGRSANIANHPRASIELGTSWFTNDLQWSTVRINFKPSESVVLFADYSALSVNWLPTSASSASNFPGYGVGGGILFSVPDLFRSFDVAFNGSYHASVARSKTDRSLEFSRVTDLQQWQLNANLIISPIDPVYENGLYWYSSFGYVSTGAQVNQQQEQNSITAPVLYRQKDGVAIGAGIVLPLRHWGVYGGAAWLSNHPLLSGGIRYDF